MKAHPEMDFSKCKFNWDINKKFNIILWISLKNFYFCIYFFWIIDWFDSLQHLLNINIIPFLILNISVFILKIIYYTKKKSTIFDY